MDGSRALYLGISLFLALMFFLPRGDAIAASPAQSDSCGLRALEILGEWQYPLGRFEGVCSCAGPEIAILDQTMSIVAAPIQEVWDFYAKKITPPDEVAPSWSPGRYSDCYGGRTPQMQYLMYQLPSEAMGGFVIHRRDRTIYIHVFSGRLDEKTYIVMTNDEPFLKK